MKTNRRQFLTRLAVAAAVPGMPRLNFAGNSTATGIARSTDEPHTLICIFLRGGADTLNLWVPYADDHYYRLRPTLSIKAPGADTDAAIRVSDHYALHPMMRPLEAAFKEGRFGAVQSVGVKNDSGSHFECQDQMEHGLTLIHGTPLPAPLSLLSLSERFSPSRYEEHRVPASCNDSKISA